MPSNIAHMLISHKAIYKIKEKYILAKAKKALKKTIDIDSWITFLKDKINLLQFSQRIGKGEKWQKK